MFYIQFFILKMSESLILSFLVSNVSESLRSLRGNERSWANCSGRSPKMSKWVNRSQSLIWFEQNEQNEQMSEWAMREWANSQPWRELLKNSNLIDVSWKSLSIYIGQKTSDLLGKQMSEFPALGLSKLAQIFDSTLGVMILKFRSCLYSRMRKYFMGTRWVVDSWNVKGFNSEVAFFETSNF